MTTYPGLPNPPKTGNLAKLRLAGFVTHHVAPLCKSDAFRQEEGSQRDRPRLDELHPELPFRGCRPVSLGGELVEVLSVQQPWFVDEVPVGNY